MEAAFLCESEFFPFLTPPGGFCISSQSLTRARTFAGAFSHHYGNMMAALVMAAVPAIIVYIALQKYSTGGVAAGGVKS